MKSFRQNATISQAFPLGEISESDWLARRPGTRTSQEGKEKRGTMRKDLLRRLEKMEQHFAPKRQPVVPVWLRHAIDAARRNALAPNERLVSDVYRITGLVGEARQRITTDLDDKGRKCDRDGYLEDVIRELHEQCEWRDKGGVATAAA
jgi:hypothetical protein